MSVLYAPDGKTHARQDVLEMTVGMMRVFLDGAVLLRSLGELHRWRVKVVCERCGSQASAAYRPVQNDVLVACDHRPSGGHVQVNRALDVEPLLLALGWGFRCTACGERLTGDNDPTATEFTVSCPCTRRVARLPRA